MRGSKNCGTFTQWDTTQQRERSPNLRDSMGGTGEHCAEWNKPGGERQIPYDLTCKWNLINKTNKGAKHNHRPGNKEQTDSDQVGWGWRKGEKRGRVKRRNTHERPMDKVKGRGGLNVGRWGWRGQGRATGEIWLLNNCYWTTIKIIFKTSFCVCVCVYEPVWKQPKESSPRFN